MFKVDAVVLSKLQREDLPELLVLKGESWSATHNVTIANMEDQERWFNSLDQSVHSPRNLVLRATEDHSFFGIYKIFNIDYVNRQADVAWDVFSEYRGKGLGKKLVLAGSMFCFSILNLRRLNAEIIENNEASIKCAKHAGFVQEGLKRESVHKEGKYLDSFMFGLLRVDGT